MRILRHGFMVVGALCVVFAGLGVLAVWLLDLTRIDIIFAIIGVEIGVIAIMITYWFGRTHTTQLNILNGIASKLETNTTIRDNVTKLLLIDNGYGAKYKCIFPVRYIKLPLPLIAAGDFYALHIVQSLVGGEGLELRALNQEAKYDDPDRIDSSLFQGNCIFLCAPIANSALGMLAPALNLEHRPSPAHLFFGDTLTLPAWIGTRVDGTAKDGRPWIRKVIYYFPDESDPSLPAYQETESPVESNYRQANLLDEGEQPELLNARQQDYGILLRVTLPNFKLQEGKLVRVGTDTRKVVVIAGIHQYGTWMAGEFFHRVTTGEITECKEIVFGQNDFMMVLSGEFDPKKFAVATCSARHVWHYVDGRWKEIHRMGSSFRPR